MDVQIQAPRSQRRYFYAIVAATLLAGVATWSYATRRPVIDVGELTFAAVASGKVKFDVSAYGILAPAKQQLLTAFARSTVQRVLIQPGQSVVAGQPIIELASPELEEAGRHAKAAVDEAMLELREAELAAELVMVEEAGKTRAAKRRMALDQAEQLALKPIAEKGIVSKLEMKRFDLKAAISKGEFEDQAARQDILRRAGRAKIDAQREAVADARSAYQESQRRIDDLMVASAVEAKVQEIYVTAGQSLAAGERIAQVAMGDALMARLQVPQARSAAIREGAAVALEFNGKKYTGVVRRVDPRVRDGSVQVDVSPTAPLPAWVKEGQAVTAEIQASAAGNATYLPRLAAFPAYSQQRLFVSRGKELVRRDVRLGGESGRYVEVVAGLQAGDRVAIGVPADLAAASVIAIGD